MTDIIDFPDNGYKLSQERAREISDHIFKKANAIDKPHIELRGNFSPEQQEAVEKAVNIYFENNEKHTSKIIDLAIDECMKYIANDFKIET